MSRKITLTPSEQDKELRLDAFISLQLSDVSRSMAERLIAGGHVILSGRPAKKNRRLAEGDVVEVNLPDPVAPEVKPEEIVLDVAYEDEYLLVVNKPKGMVVHPAPGNRDGTLVNALLAHCGSSLSGINGVLRPGIVHRIDKDTSGLLIVAKNDAAHAGLAAQIKEHSFTREYETVVCGRMRDGTDELTVDKPIGRSGADRKKMAVNAKNGRRAVTRLRVVARYPGFTHLRCLLETGRTHQIRVHLSSIGYPVLGDPVYGGDRSAGARFSFLRGQCLHAKRIAFVHPVTGEKIDIESPLPAYFRRVLELLGGID